MTDSAKGHAPILAAGGIVLRGNARPRFAVVRLRREKAWVLPKGKLLPREHPRDAAKREVLEETGHDVSVHQISRLDGVCGRRQDQDRAVLADARRRPAGAGTDERRQSREMAAVAASRRYAEPPARKGVPYACRTDRARCRQKVRRAANRGPPSATAAGGGAAARPSAPVEHVIAMDYAKTRPNAFVKALGNWIGRVTQARRAGPS